jgi:hypothetical protein
MQWKRLKIKDKRLKIKRLKDKRLKINRCHRVLESLGPRFYDSKTL